MSTKRLVAFFLIALVTGELVRNLSALQYENDFRKNLNQMRNFYCAKALVLDVIFDSDDLPFGFEFFQSCTCIRFTAIKKPFFSQVEKKIYNLIVLKNFQSFERIMDNLSVLNFDRSGFFSLIFFEINREEKTKVLQLAWNNFMHNFNVIDVVSAQWSTFEPFLDGKSRMKTTTENFFSNKLLNLHRRPLRIPVLNYLPGLEFKNDLQPSGIEGEILAQLSCNLNFTILPFKMENEDEKWGTP